MAAINSSVGRFLVSLCHGFRDCVCLSGEMAFASMDSSLVFLGRSFLDGVVALDLYVAEPQSRLCVSPNWGGLARRQNPSRLLCGPVYIGLHRDRDGCSNGDGRTPMVSCCLRRPCSGPWLFRHVVLRLLGGTVQKSSQSARISNKGKNKRGLTTRGSPLLIFMFQ